MPNFELNPILVREVRARWRKWPAFAVVFSFAALLAIVVWWRYVAFSTDAELTLFDHTRGTALGRELFTTLTITQVAGWMLLAPLLTTTGLFNERELGLMQAVQLSELAARQIINGKLLSMLAFVVLMLLAPLPVIAVCFLLGGVAPFEVVVATLISFMTATTSGLIGLNCAAWNSGRGNILGKTLAGLTAWIVLPGTLFHPACMLCLLLSDDAVPGCYLYGSLVGCSMLALLVWRNAVQGLSRPLWQQDKVPTQPAPGDEPQSTIHLSHDAPHAERALLVKTPTVRRRQQLPLLARLRFANPIMQHDVRRTLRPRWAGATRSAYKSAKENTSVIGVLLVGCSFVCSLPVLVYAFVCYNLAVYCFVTWLGLALILLLGVTRGAETFARERELHTWEGLRLTPLSCQQIIAGKLGAVLFTCFCYALPLQTGMFLCVRSLSFPHSSLSSWYTGIVSLPQILGAALIGAAAVWCYTAFAMLVSWWCKRTWVAMAWILALPLLIVLSMSVGGELSDRTHIGAGLLLCNPWAGFAAVQSALTLHDAALQVAHSAGVMLALGSGFLLVLFHLMSCPRTERMRCNLLQHRLS